MTTAPEVPSGTPPCDPGFQKQSKPRKAGRFSFRYKVMLLLAALLFTFGLLEGALYVCGYTALPYSYVGEYEFKTSANFVEDPAIGWRMRPNHEFSWTVVGRDFNFYSNDDGFRAAGAMDKAPPADGFRTAGAMDKPLPADGFRAAVARDTPLPGDRFPAASAKKTAPPHEARRIVVAGDSFMWGYGVEHDEMCSSLLAAGIRDCGVRNIAMPGFGVDQISLALHEWGFEPKPDLVVVGFYYNDFVRTFDACRLPERITKPLFKLEGGCLVRQTEEDQPNALIKTLEHHSRAYGIIRRLKRRLGVVHGLGSFWSLNQAFLESIRADCAKAGVPVLFVHFPSLEGGAFPALKAYMEECKAHYIDFYELWGGAKKELYFVEDPHLNVEGHRVVGETILKWIRNNLNWPLSGK